MRSGRVGRLAGAMFVTALLGGLPAAAAAKTPKTPKTRVFVRIEGATRTIFEGWVSTGPVTITTAGGGTHECTGTNNGANPTPGATPGSALATAANRGGFTFDGTFDSEFDDFFFSRIGETSQTDTEFWDDLVDYQYNPTGDCADELSSGQEVLWAFNAFNASHFLKLEKLPKKRVRVTDGATGSPVEGATVGPAENNAGPITNAAGEATLSFVNGGAHRVKATAPYSIRSNSVVVGGR